MRITPIQNFKKRWIFFLMIFGVAGIDQLSKYLILTYLKPIGEYKLIPGVFHFTYVENRGAAFGMLQDARWVFMITSVIAILAIVIAMLTMPKLTAGYCASLAMVAGGGLGNMIDRAALGYVVDFLNAECINFAVFNVADSFVCIGVALMMLCMIRDELSQHKKKDR